MSQHFPRGSEWRKWDLHVHAPGTKLNDGYKSTGEVSAVEQFCQAIHDSEVAAVAIADYFSLDSYFLIKDKFKEMFPEDKTLLLPNLELRLPLALNREDQEVNLHLIFNPTLTRDQADKFIGRLSTESTTGRDGATVTCADLKSESDFKSATVSHHAVNEAIKQTFGSHAVVQPRRQEYLIVATSAKGDGIRPGGNGIERKNLLTDEIDKFSDAIFSNYRSRNHFLNTDRLEGSDKVAAKPVLDGCDAHTFDALAETFGKHSSKAGNERSITWVKADPTYSGLLQTLIEPADRVAIQATQPDHKEPYKVISKVKFSGTDRFPEEIVFNQNLNSIIGSRSSGKSALLAYIAHAVNPAETIRKQMEALNTEEERLTGPGAGLSWEEVQEIQCEVEWGHGGDSPGKVIFIPQNSLYRLSEQPEDITKKIEPALFRSYPLLRTQFDQAQATVTSKNKSIHDAVNDWFDKASQIEAKVQEIRNLGDKKAIGEERDRLQAEISRIQSSSQLSNEEMSSFQEVSNQLKENETRLDRIETELQQLGAYVVWPDNGDPQILPQSVSATISIAPTGEHLADTLQGQIADLRDRAKIDLEAKVESALVDAAKSLRAEKLTVTKKLTSIKEENVTLLEKHQANEELAEVVAAHKKQVATLDNITRTEKEKIKLQSAQQEISAQIQTFITEREQALTALREQFNTELRVLSDLHFGLEIGVSMEKARHVAIGFNRRKSKDYVSASNGAEPVVEFEKAQEDPATFLQQLYSEKVGLKSGYDVRTVATDVLTLSKEVRFSAELDSDRIGGFEKSSMTPGKQALFALTLILNESQEPWPLLIDQPEDDLDSRSIYETIVPYLAARKKERQIIMVSHNANLVIGADSEQVTVANRHGDDRRNRSGQMFNYLTGSLEYSEENSTAPYELERWGIREHAVEILDGGEEAFQKRREKYKLPSAI